MLERPSMSDAGPGVDSFERDVLHTGGYAYTTGRRLSSSLANARMTAASLAAAAWREQRVVDLGCGDGTYTAELLELGEPASIHGIDPSPAAVLAAQKRVDDPRLTFAVGSAYEVPAGDGEFDVAYLRGVLHHTERPFDVLAEALRVAPLIVVVEPNGYNAGLKVLERVSTYHREHGETSYSPRRLDRWVTELGATVLTRDFIGFVPMFSSDRYARVAKRLEPWLERRRCVREATCAQYVFSAAAGARRRRA